MEHFRRIDYQLNSVEAVVTMVFTVEYVARVIVVRNRTQYMLRTLVVLDLLAILPFYMEVLFTERSDFTHSISGVLRVLRLSRVAKIRQLSTPYTQMLNNALINSLWGTGSS
eukprot:UN31630